MQNNEQRRVTVNPCLAASYTNYCPGKKICILVGRARLQPSRLVQINGSAATVFFVK